MSCRLHPRRRAIATWSLALLAALSGPAQAQTAAAPSNPPEAALTREDLLPHLEEIQRHYPRLYERLRRGAPGANRAALQAPRAAAPAGEHRPQDIGGLLRQEVRSRPAGGGTP